ncbi:MAG: hypothetical protein HZA51_17020 [Planctomycetes bacterium]|nr:hypothetical protein [Planctomycetota bacterium]
MSASDAQKPLHLVARAEQPAKIIHLTASLVAVALIGVSGDLLLTVAVFLLIVALIAEGVRTVRLSALRRALQECDYQRCLHCGAPLGKDRRPASCSKCKSLWPIGKLRDMWESALDL